jgi:transcriptional regulator with XRE-family HTH domain
MGYQLQMSAEIYDWLAELRGSDPPAAVLTAQALAALAADADRLGPPLVIAVADRLRPDELLTALDRRYQGQLESMNAMRRRVAEAATLRKDIERQLAELESPRAAQEMASARDGAAGLRERLAAAIEAEKRLTVASQREQMRVDAFRTRKEVLKAVYTAARAEQLIEQAQGQDADEDGVWQVDPDWLDEITGQIERELGPYAPAEGLMELRPGTPADSGIRILFAVEPPGAALLIAVLEGRDAVRDHHREAVLLASGVLREARAGQAAEAAARTFGDAQSFLEEFFPGRADELRAGAAALVAASRARTLTEQRVRLGLTQAQVAARMGVRQERVSAIERAEPGATEVRTLAGYVEALGGRLDIIADFGTERILLPNSPLSSADLPASRRCYRNYCRGRPTARRIRVTCRDHGPRHGQGRQGRRLRRRVCAPARPGREGARHAPLRRPPIQGRSARVLDHRGLRR